MATLLCSLAFITWYLFLFDLGMCVSPLDPSTPALGVSLADTLSRVGGGWVVDGDIPMAYATYSCVLGQDMELVDTLKHLSGVRAIILEPGSRPANAGEVIAFVEEQYRIAGCTEFQFEGWSRITTIPLPMERLRPEERLAMLELQVAAAKAKVKQEGGDSPTSPLEVVDLTTGVQQGSGTVYFLDPIATLEQGKEVPEERPTRTVRLAAFGLLARCVRPNHPHILANKPEGDVAGVLAAVRALGMGNRASQIWSHLRWLGSTSVESEGLPAYLTRLANARAFLSTNATGIHAFGSALLLEAVLEAAASSTVLSADLALARRDGTNMDTFVASLTARSVEPATVNLSANVAVRGRGGGAAPKPAAAHRPALLAFAYPKDTNPVVPSELPAGTCFMHLRSGKSPCEGGCSFKHDEALRASYLAGKMQCKHCMKRHVPRRCPFRRDAKKTANVAAVDADEDDGELGACIVGLSGLKLEDFY